MIYLAIFAGAFFRVAIRVLAQHNTVAFRWKQTPVISAGLSLAELATWVGSFQAISDDGGWAAFFCWAILAVGGTLGSWCGMWIEIKWNGRSHGITG